MPTLDELVAQHNPAQEKPLSLDEALASTPEWRDSGYGFKVRKAVTPDTGKPTEQSEEGYLYYGPDQGNTGKPGWFNDKGQPVQPKQTGPRAIPSTGQALLRAVGNAPLSSAGMPTVGQFLPPDSTQEHLPTVGSAVMGGVVKPALGAAQLATHAVGSSAMDPAVNAVDAWSRENLNKSTSGELVGAAVPLAFTGGASAATKAPSAVQNALAFWKGLNPIAKGAATGAVLAPTLTPEANVQGNGDYWGRKGEETAFGAGLGMAIPLGLKGAQMGIDMGRNGVASFLRWLAPKFNPEKAAAILEAAEKMGVNMRPSTIIAGSQDPAREVAGAEEAVRRVSKGFRDDMLATPFEGLEDITAASKAAGPRQNAAQEVLEYVKNSGLNPEDVLKTSAKIRALQEKMRLDKLALVRDSLAGELQNVDVSPVITAIDGAVEQLRLDSRGGNEQVIKGLLAWRDRLTRPAMADHLGIANTGGSVQVARSASGGAGDHLFPASANSGAADHLGITPSGRTPVVPRGGGEAVPEVRDIYGTVLQPSQPAAPPSFAGGNPVAGSPATPAGSVATEIIHIPGPPDVNPRSFQSLSATRSSLSNDISALYKGQNSQTGSAPAHILQPLKNALDETLERAAQQSGNPQLTAADRIFRAEYSKYKSDYADPLIRKALETPDPDALVASIRRMGEDKAQRLFDSLDPRGKKAFLSGLWDEMVRGAWNKRTGDFIPGNISGGLFDASRALGVAVKGENAQLLGGMNVVMQALAKSDPKLASALGQRFVEGAMGEVSPKGAMAVKFVQKLKDKGIDFLFDSQAGKDFLFKAGSLPPSSPAFWNLVNKDAPRIMAVRSAPLPTIANPSSLGGSTVTPKPDQLAQQ